LAIERPWRSDASSCRPSLSIRFRKVKSCLMMLASILRVASSLFFAQSQVLHFHRGSSPLIDIIKL
jgi:hypothetical protein